jgi:hypothetical protein
VAGPTEISADDWEKKFVELQQNTMVTIGADIWDEAELDMKKRDDDFAKWINSQQP